jgi:hypothetical protein
MRNSGFKPEQREAVDTAYVLADMWSTAKCAKPSRGKAQMWAESSTIEAVIVTTIEVLGTTN